MPRDQFFQFSWRPRAPSLLSKEQEAEIAKHLKDYSKRDDEIDSKLLQEVRCSLLSLCCLPGGRQHQPLCFAFSPAFRLEGMHALLRVRPRHAAC